MKNNITKKKKNTGFSLSKKDIIFFITTFLVSVALSFLLFNTPNMNFITSNMVIERSIEKIILLTKRNPQDKALYMSTLLDKRLSDLQQIVAARNYPLFLSASLRYSTTAGNVTALVLQSKSPELQHEILVKFYEHTKILKKLLEQQDNLNQDWKFIEDDINYLSVYSAQLSKIQ